MMGTAMKAAPRQALETLTEGPGHRTYHSVGRGFPNDVRAFYRRGRCLMAVTARIRFEILRRDNYSCKYCGATASDVKLVVDHVVPKSLGGTDEVTNLVTACHPCNAGKASVAPDSPIADDVKASAVRHAELMRGAYAVLIERFDQQTEYEDQVDEAYDFVAPDGWRDSVGRWFRMGVPVEIPVNAARAASEKPWFRGFDRFRYLCGIVWNQIAAVDALTAEKVALAGRFFTDQDLEDYGIEHWKRGWDIGWKRAIESVPSEERRYTEQELANARMEMYEDGRAMGLQLAKYEGNPVVKEEIEWLRERYERLEYKWESSEVVDA